MLISLSESSRIIHLCGNPFDSHQFILFLIMTNPYLYFDLLGRYHHDVMVTDQQIGIYLEKMQERLRIRKLDVVRSLNINSNENLCALWEKTY